MSEDYDTVIQVPVTFTHLPKNKALTFISDTALQVEIVDKGSSLFRLIYVEKISPVNISLRFLPLYPKNGTFQGFVTPSLLINEIEREKNLLGKIVSISPDTIYLSLEPEKSRKIPVKADFELTYEKQFMKYGQVIFHPDCVLVRGPERTIAELDSVSLGKIKIDQLNENFSGKKVFPGDSANKNLSFTPASVDYEIPVEKFTEAELDVPVKITNTNGLKIKTFPDKVRVFYTVALKDYPKIEPGVIQAVADLNTENKAAGSNKLKIVLESFPSYIRINKIDPEKVEYIILK